MYPVTTALLTIYVAFYCAGMIAQGGPVEWRHGFEILPLETSTLLDFGGLTIRAIGPAAELWRLLTATLLHVGIAHLFMNGFALFQIGAWIEDWFGGAVLLTLHMFFGLAGNVVSILFHSRDAQFAQVGASGAIFGLIAFIAVVSRQSKFASSHNAFWILFGWIVFSLLLGWNIGADNAAHLGGALAGTLTSLFAFVLRPGLMPRGALRISGLLSIGVYVLAFGLQARVGISSHRARVEARRIHRRMVVVALDRRLQTVDSLRQCNPLSLENPMSRKGIVDELQNMLAAVPPDKPTSEMCQAYIAALGGPQVASWQLNTGLTELEKAQRTHETWAARQGLRTALGLPASRQM